jgi:hypothetical protein
MRPPLLRGIPAPKTPGPSANQRPRPSRDSALVARRITRMLGTAWLALAAASDCPGAASAADDDAAGFSAVERALWSLQPVASAAPPRAANRQWIANPIDAFILARLEKEHLTPGPPADRTQLLRRVTLDLTGLPPTLEETDAFLDDPTPDAFARVVDRLLSSPRYGERWARHWLDLARYAESEGFKSDETRPNAWRYRDYVIGAFNQDKPYDRFVREQIAGDELWPDDPDARIATGFNRHYPDESNARNLMQRRQEILNDITDTVGSVFTGLTFACARCHRHKFDPILQTDYYRLQAFFANTAADDNIPLLSPSETAVHRQRLSAWEAKTAAIRAEIDALEAPHREALIKDFVDKYPEEIQVALAKPESERTPFECQMVAKARLYLDPRSHQYLAPSSALAGRLKGDARKRWDSLNAELRSYASLHPGPTPIATGITDLGTPPPPTHLLRRGMWDAPRETVAPGFLSVLDAVPAAMTRPAPAPSTGPRAALAQILTDPSNPLTARVMANRLWAYHFGRGLAATPSDLGFKGEPPTHPGLLDWLATELMRGQWSLKRLHRLILTSATYQQSSAFRADAAARDPENRVLWRFPRQRLEGEAIRDAMLATAGLLNLKTGGPSVFPELPAGLETRGGWKLTPGLAERNRRSVYVFVRRNTRYPMFEAFDMPDTHESCSRRNLTTSPVQALTLLNSRLTWDWAQAFAERVRRSTGNDRTAQIDLAFRLAFSRAPDAAERGRARDFLTSQQALLDAGRAPGEASESKDSGAQAATPPATPLADFCHALLNANEFVYRP